MNIRASHRACFHYHLIYHHIYRPPLVFFIFFLCFLSYFLLFSSACCQLPVWVFQLAFFFPNPRHGLSRLDSYSPRPVFSPLPTYQLPARVFSLAFFFPNPRHGLSRLDSYSPHPVFSPLSAYQLPNSPFRLAFLSLSTHNKIREAVHPPSSYHFLRVQVHSSSRCSCPVPVPRTL